MQLSIETSTSSFGFSIEGSQKEIVLFFLTEDECTVGI